MDENDNYLKYVSILNMQEYLDETIRDTEALTDDSLDYLAWASKATLVACLATQENKDSSYKEAISLIDKALDVMKIADENIHKDIVLGFEEEIKNHFFFMDASENEKTLFKMLGVARKKHNHQDILECSEKLLEINPDNTMAWVMMASSTTYAATNANVFTAYKKAISYLDTAIKTDSSWERIIDHSRYGLEKHFTFLGYKEGLEEKIQEVQIQEPQKINSVSNDKNTVVPIIMALIFFALFIQFLSNSTPEYEEAKEVKENHVEKPLEVKNDNANVDVSKLTKTWNDAHSSKDITVLANLFDKSILFYGENKDKNFFLENKLKLFRKFTDFHQEIEDIRIEKQPDGTVKSSFLKRVTINKKTKDYPSYLIFKNMTEGWKIVAESDLTTDKNLAKNTEPKKEIIETVSSIPTVSSDVHQSSYSDMSDSLENMAALSAAPLLCGFKVNESMVAISMTALFPNPSDLNRGGKYWDEFERDLDRIEMLASTESGKQSFCNRIKIKLSAFFD